MRRFALLVLLLACASSGALPPPSPPAPPPPAPSTSPPTVAERVRDSVLKGSKAHDVVRELADGVGPRLAGSPGDARAVAWARKAMVSLGLSNVREEPVRVPVWVRGVETAQVLSPAPQPLMVTALGGSVGTPEGGIEAEVVEAASFEDFARLPDEAVKGKIAFFNPPQMERLPTGRGYGVNVRYRSEGASAAARRGAVAVLVRSVSSAGTRLPHTGAMRYADGIPKIPAAAVSTPDADLLHRLGGKVRVRLALTCKTLPDALSANVVGEIPGRERPEEIFLLGAHLDSWDLGTGALDDGAGVGIVLETARQILAAGAPPRRTIRFVLFANEENGLRGGEAYAEAHKAEVANHVAALEADAGDGPPTMLGYMGGPELAAALAPFAALLAPLGVGPAQPAQYAGADLSPLRRAGVPMLHVGQDATRYFDYHHSADDTYDKVHPDELARAAAAYAAVTYAAADSSAPFGRLVEPPPAPGAPPRR